MERQLPASCFTRFNGVRGEFVADPDRLAARPDLERRFVLGVVLAAIGLTVAVVLALLDADTWTLAGSVFSVAGVAVGATAFVGRRRHRQAVRETAERVHTPRAGGWMPSAADTFIELRPVRNQLRQLAVGEHGHLIGDDLLIAVDRATFTAAQAAHRERDLRSRLASFSTAGPASIELRTRLSAQADAEAATVTHCAAQVRAAHVAASEAIAAFDGLDPADITSALEQPPHTAELDAHCEHLQAIAAAARDIEAPAALPQVSSPAN